MTTAPGPTLLDAASLLCEVADELVVRSARDTHLAVLDRVHGVGRAITRAPAGPVERAHRGIAGAVYGGLGVGLRAASRGLDRAAETGAGPRLETRAEGRFLAAAVNGLIGDRLLHERPQMAIPMAVRSAGADVPAETGALAAAFPQATGQVAIFLHGLCEDESAWGLGREQRGSSYPDALAALGWTPVLLRANTGLPLRENGVALTALLRDVVASWPVPVTRVALVGHSMGGLIMRAAAAVAAEHPGEAAPWTSLVTDVVTLGTPHLGAPLATHVGHGSRGLGVLAETAAFSRILELRSAGVRDLVAGLSDDVPALPHARYRLVAATLTDTDAHPVIGALGDLLGDLLVRPGSAEGRDRRGRTLFPDADVLRVGGTHHFGILNHDEVERALRDWLA